MTKAGTTSSSVSVRFAYNPDLPPPVSCWPDDSQRLLLQACLCAKDQAVPAYLEWSSRTDILRMDHGSNRLMALLFRNLEKHGIRGPHHERIRGNWRYHWYQNKLLLDQYASLSAGMEKAGIPVIALKGIPLALFYYQDMGVRPMSDFDILVRSDKVLDAITFLKNLGYQSKQKSIERHLRYANGCGFFKKGGVEIDLHWRVLHDCFYPWSDEAFWEASVIEKKDGLACRTLCPADHFLHICAHGMRYNRIPPLRWLADAWMVLQQTGGRLDYNRLIHQAGRRQLSLPVQKTIGYFKQHFSLPERHPACLAMRRLPVAFHEKMEYPCRIHNPELLPSYIPLWFQYRRWKQCGETARPAKGFLDYYAQRRGLPGRRTALLYILKASFKKSLALWLKNLFWKPQKRKNAGSG